MNKLYFISFLLLLSSSINAQCTIGLPYHPQFLTQATSTIQTFQPTCSGTIKNVVVLGVPSFAEDLRDYGGAVMVQCRIKSSTGTLLAAGPMTDQWYPGATNITFDFSCSNLNLVSGTTYQLEFLGIFSPPYTPWWLVLFSRSNTSLYAGGHVIQDGVANLNHDLRGWAVNMDNGSIAASNAAQTQVIAPCNGFYNAASELITAVQPGATNGIAGSTTAKVWIEGAQPAQFVKRHYEITPATNATTATGRVTLYFTQAEFDDFNAVNTLKLPIGPSDATGKANLLIEKMPGNSSNGTGLPNTYTGTPVTINPADADIVWNSSTSRWEVSFDVTGFSGFFAKTSSTSLLPVEWISASGRLVGQAHAQLTWEVQETSVSHYELEKSTDGTRFAKVATQPSQGDGTHAYSATDPTALKGTGYYRIRQVDLDGQFSYSKVVALSNHAGGSIAIYPNPVSEVLHISGATEGTTAFLTDLSGRVLRQVAVEESATSIEMDGMNSGLYLLKTSDGLVVKVVKE